jgi:glycosyltransferase involved in cell wall biosynthesis
MTSNKTYSVVIPVFNSASIVGATIDRTVAFFESHGLSYELILVDDGSKDNSWNILRNKAEENSNLLVVKLLKNYGQHNANMCGFRHSTGDYVITMDDDLQNQPEEIIHLIEKAEEGYDLVIGRFRKKKHPLFRRLGTKLIDRVNRAIFSKPKDFVLTNFRLMRRDVVDRICRYKTPFPYTPGLALMFSSTMANVWVEHQARTTQKSGYTLFKIFKLVATILFNYSSYPLRLTAVFGIAISVFSFFIGGFYFIRAIMKENIVPGWTSIIVLLAFFNGVLILILSMIGEYLVRLLNQTSASESYYIKEAFRKHD